MWQINWNLNKSIQYIFLIQGQAHSFAVNLVPESWKSHFRALKFQNFLSMEHAATSDPPRGTGLLAPCWYSGLLYSNLLATSIIIETPGVIHCLIYFRGFFRGCISTWASFSLASRLKIPSSQILVSFLIAVSLSMRLWYSVSVILR